MDLTKYYGKCIKINNDNERTDVINILFELNHPWMGALNRFDRLSCQKESRRYQNNIIIDTHNFYHGWLKGSIPASQFISDYYEY